MGRLIRAGKRSARAAAQGVAACPACWSLASMLVGPCLQLSVATIAHALQEWQLVQQLTDEIELEAGPLAAEWGGSQGRWAAGSAPVGSRQAADCCQLGRSAGLWHCADGWRGPARPAAAVLTNSAPGRPRPPRVVLPADKYVMRRFLRARK